MNKGTKLSGQSKEAQSTARNREGVEKVRDFLARYSGDDDFFAGTAESPLAPSVALVAEEAREKTAEGEAVAETPASAFPFATGHRETFRIIDDDLPAPESEQAPENACSTENPFAPTPSPGETFAYDFQVEDAADLDVVVFDGEEPAGEGGVRLPEQTEPYEWPDDSRDFEGQSAQLVEENVGQAQGWQDGREEEIVQGAAPDDLQSGVAARAGLDPRLVSFLAPDSFAAEQYRALRSLVERLREETGKSCIVAVTSPTVGDGKTTTAINLAGALAQASDARVLLVDANLHRPSIKERLGEEPIADRGLVDAVLRSGMRLHDVAVRYAALNLSVLPAGQPASSGEALKSPRFAALLAEARRSYDYVVIDLPPLAPAPDCQLIEQSVDGFFVVVAAHTTPRKLVRETLSVIRDEKILGLVFNGDDS